MAEEDEGERPRGLRGRGTRSGWAWIILSSLIVAELAIHGALGRDKKEPPVEHEEEAVVQVLSKVVTHGENVNVASGKMKMNIVFLSPADRYCEDEQRESLCFFEDFSFRVIENRGPTKLGIIRPVWLKKFCPLISVSYSVTSDSSNFFEISNSEENIWFLKTTKPLDREAFEWMAVEVECSLSHESRGVLINHRRIINVTILDEDDSPPEPQLTDLDIHIPEPLLLQDTYFNTGQMIINDKDSIEVNNYTVDVLTESDPPGVLSIRLQNWEVPAGKDENVDQTEKAISATSYDSNKSLITGKTRSTAIHVEASVVRTVKLRSPVYMVTFNLIDSTLKGNKGKAKITMHLRIIVDSLYKSQRGAEIGMGLNRLNDRRNENSGIDNSQDLSYIYPSFINIPEKCGPFTRIAQPDRAPPNDYDIDAKLVPYDSPVDITPKSGIIFVKDPSKLKVNGTTHIKVGWRGFKKDASIELIVVKSTAKCSPSNRKNTCASAKLKRTCESMCGIGALEYCIWRESTNAKGLFPTGFSTCSPNSKTCPDGFCDELEEEDHRICPQDCAHEVFGAVVQNEPHYNAGRGIKGATGVCTCDEILKCSCAPEYKGNRGNQGKSAMKSFNGSDKEGQSDQGGHKLKNGDQSIKDPGAKKEDNDGKPSDKYFETCGENCMVAVALGVVAAFTIAVAGAIYSKRRNCDKEENELSTAVPIATHHDGRVEGIAAASLGTMSQIYGRDENNIRNQELPLLSMQPNQLYDPKWELPREALTIDGPLGEGEFGTVFKGKLRSNEGNSSEEPMTVAVKTLKEGAGDLERHALVSEFNLLKCVNHINVVKLIGACTFPLTLPLLLIIEYAAMGSLRSYLRKSRLCHFNGVSLQRLPITKPFGSEDTSKDERTSSVNVSAKHILSFAWQICKGMTYLSDLKLVHRDLAARNVLLTEDGICKISDFGLTRDVYEDDAYFKRSKGRVPVKWMAPESLSDHIYTTQSDVWGFGVLLWELVTLGATPYPGIPLSSLYGLLRAGFQMEKPDHCSDELYNVMKYCWRLDPRKRPSFPTLMSSLEVMLMDKVDYLQLDSLVAQNMSYFTGLEDLCASNTDGGMVECGSILHRILNDDSDTEEFEEAAALALNAAQNKQQIEKNEGKVEYALLWKGNKERGWNESDGKNLSQGLLEEIDEVDEDNLAIDQGNGEEVLNIGMANQYLLEYECPIKLPDQTQSNSP